MAEAAREFDIIVYGATGYTGRLVAEHLLKTYGADGEIDWAMAGRSAEQAGRGARPDRRAGRACRWWSPTPTTPRRWRRWPHAPR